MYKQRLDKLREQTLARGFDAVALVPGSNMSYISGIRSHLSERPIVLFIPVDDDPVIIIPGLEAPKAVTAGIAPDRIHAWSDEDGYASAFQHACAQLELSDVLLGVEALHMRVLELEMLQRYAPNLKTAHAEPILSALRMRKDAAELDAIERAVAVAEIAMHNLVPQLHAGQTEKEAAAMLLRELLSAGAHGLAFDPIVSAGANAASPHAVPTDRVIQKGDLLIVDWGAMVDGYVSDITRTFAVGAIAEELAQVYEAVRAANAAGRAAAGPGRSGEEIDIATRTVIENAGYGDYFIHRTGHGIGVETHEGPEIVRGNAEPLPVGATFTVEPGIYLPGRGGVRIEDNVVITAEGARTLTSFPRDLTTISG